MREQLTGLGIACPRFAPVTGLAGVEEFAAGPGRWCLRRSAAATTARACGCAVPGEAADVLGHGVGLVAEEYVAFTRELAVLAARFPHRQGAVYPVVETVQRDGIAGR